jgi:hypothetical protein
MSGTDLAPALGICFWNCSAPSYQGLEIRKFPMGYGRKGIARFRCYSSMVVVKQWQDITKTIGNY